MNRQSGFQLGGMISTEKPFMIPHGRISSEIVSDLTLYPMLLLMMIRDCGQRAVL